MNTNRETVDKFYRSIASANSDALADILDPNLELIIPISNGVLSGHYRGKTKFMTEILPLVFSCVNQEEITFCKDYKIIAADEQTVVAMAQNYGLASSGARYDQVYVHILTFHDGKLIRLIEYFDSALADRALWGDSAKLPADAPFNLSNISS